MCSYSNEATAMLRSAMEHARTDCGGCEAKGCTAAVMDAVAAVVPKLSQAHTAAVASAIANALKASKSGQGASLAH